MASIDNEFNDTISDEEHVDESNDNQYNNESYPDERLTDFQIFKNSEKYNISDVWDNKEKPLYDQKMGYAFVDKEYNLTDDMEKAVRFVGIVGTLKANPLLEKSYSSITFNALHNKRIVISGIQLDIPMRWIIKDIPPDGRDHSSILKLKYNNRKKSVTYYNHIDKDMFDFSESNSNKSMENRFFDLGRYHIYKDKKGNSRCYLKVNDFIIHPFGTFSKVIHKNDQSQKKSHLHTQTID